MDKQPNKFGKCTMHIVYLRISHRAAGLTVTLQGSTTHYWIQHLHFKTIIGCTVFVCLFAFRLQSDALKSIPWSFREINRKWKCLTNNRKIKLSGLIGNSRFPEPIFCHVVLVLVFIYLYHNDLVYFVRRSVFRSSWD